MIEVEVVNSGNPYKAAKLRLSEEPTVLGRKLRAIGAEEREYEITNVRCYPGGLKALVTRHTSITFLNQLALRLQKLSVPFLEQMEAFLEAKSRPVLPVGAMGTAGVSEGGDPLSSGRAANGAAGMQRQRQHLAEPEAPLTGSHALFGKLELSDQATEASGRRVQRMGLLSAGGSAGKYGLFHRAPADGLGKSFISAAKLYGKARIAQRGGTSVGTGMSGNLSETPG